MEFPALRAAFERDGFALVHGALDPISVSNARGHHSALAARLGLDADAVIVAAPPGDPGSEGLAADVRLFDLAAALLGPETRCFGVSYLTKPPYSGLPTRWHQDAGPWAERLHGAHALSVWVALTDADETNGCLSVVPGSHRLAAQALLPDDGEPSLFGVGMDESLVELERTHQLPVAAGDAVILHQNLVHGAAPNDSALRREAVSLRYAAR